MWEFHLLWQLFVYCQPPKAWRESVKIFTDHCDHYCRVIWLDHNRTNHRSSQFSRKYSCFSPAYVYSHISSPCPPSPPQPHPSSLQHLSLISRYMGSYSARQTEGFLTEWSHRNLPIIYRTIIYNSLLLLCVLLNCENTSVFVCERDRDRETEHLTELELWKCQYSRVFISAFSGFPLFFFHYFSFLYNVAFFN